MNYELHKTIQKLTDENLEIMRQHQFKYTAEYLTRCIAEYSDSDIDPLPGALFLAYSLMVNTYDICDFNIDQLRLHVTHICCESTCDNIIAMLFDDDDHYDSFADRDTADTWDAINPQTL